jgi:hypothetical protein
MGGVFGKVGGAGAYLAERIKMCHYCFIRNGAEAVKVELRQFRVLLHRLQGHKIY